MLDIPLGYASICKRVAWHTYWKIFFLTSHFFLFWTVCVSFDGSNFQLQFLSGRFYCFIRRSQKWLHVWDQTLALSLEPKPDFFRDNSRLDCVRSGRMGAE